MGSIYLFHYFVNKAISATYISTIFFFLPHFLKTGPPGYLPAVVSLQLF